MKRALAAATALSFCFATAAHAQDAETTSSAGPTVGYYDEGGNWIPPSRGRAPDTCLLYTSDAADDCCRV